MKERAEGLEKIATTGDTQQLPPGTATGMAVGAEIAPARPAPIGTVRIGAEMVRGVDLTAASSRHDEAWWWGGRGSWVGGTRVFTSVAMRFGGEAHKGCGLAATLAPWWRGLRWCRLRNGTVAWPRPMEHEAQPHQGDQR